MTKQSLTIQRAGFWPLVAGFLLLFTIAAPAAAFERSYFKAPSIDGFKAIAEEDADGDGDDVKETRVKHYINASGDMIYSMTTKGTLWAWSLQVHADEDASKSYVLRDSNCDGVFDERYSLDEEYHIPDCLK